MNLLDQIAGYCKPSVSINLLDSPKQNKKNQARPTRHHSVFTQNKIHDNRNAKSIQKIQTWFPKSKQQNKQKVLLKIIRSLSTKVRKHYFTFWVNYQQAAKNKKEQAKKNNSNFAAEKIIGFVQAYQAKQCQHIGLSLAFSKIIKFSVIKSVQKTLQKVVSSALKRSQKCFFDTFQEREKQLLKLQLLINTIDLTFFTQLKLQIFNVINQYSKNVKHKASKQQNYQKKQATSSTTAAKKIAINPTKLKFNIFSSLRQQYIECIATENNEFSLKTFSKIIVDNAVQNCPQICDNSLLFIQRPIKFENTQMLPPKQSSSNDNLYSSQIKTKRCFSRPNLTATSQIFLDQQSTQKTQRIVTQNGLTKKQQYCTPKNRSISTSSIFNVDQTRISKLEKKLFGETCKIDKNQSRYMVNGQDWMNDRKALQQIMSNMKSPQKTKRLSGYDLQLEKIRQKNQNIKQRQIEKKLEKKYFMKTSGCQIQLRNQKSYLLKNLTNNDNSAQINKGEQKIIISLKSKKKELLSNSKTQQWRKLYQMQQEKKFFNLVRK